MRVEYLGGDEPEIAIIGGIHGDEPCGVNAIEHVLENEPEVERPVALIVANEKALEANERYIEEDLNRAFPGDPNGETHESRLAAQIVEEVGDCLTFSMHSTQSYSEMFALVKGLREFSREICPRLSVEAVVDIGPHDTGRLFKSVEKLIVIECGYQGSTEATENAIQVTYEFLGAVGAIPAHRRAAQRNLPLFRLGNPIPKAHATTYEVYASNFEAVEPGEPFAAVENEEIVADEGFYPILLSPYGYENLFGYTAERVGTVQPLSTTEDSTEN